MVSEAVPSKRHLMIHERNKLKKLKVHVIGEAKIGIPFKHFVLANIFVEHVIILPQKENLDGKCSVVKKLTGASIP